MRRGNTEEAAHRKTEAKTTSQGTSRMLAPPEDRKRKRKILP